MSDFTELSVLANSVQAVAVEAASAAQQPSTTDGFQFLMIGVVFGCFVAGLAFRCWWDHEKMSLRDIIGTGVVAFVMVALPMSEAYAQAFINAKSTLGILIACVPPFGLGLTAKVQAAMFRGQRPEHPAVPQAPAAPAN